MVCVVKREREIQNTCKPECFICNLYYYQPHTRQDCYRLHLSSVKPNTMSNIITMSDSVVCIPAHSASLFPSSATFPLLTRAFRIILYLSTRCPHTFLLSSHIVPLPSVLQSPQLSSPELYRLSPTCTSFTHHSSS